MGNKRVSRTDDSQYWNDPDYQEALVEFGLGPTLSSKCTPPSRGQLTERKKSYACAKKARSFLLVQVQRR